MSDEIPQGVDPSGKRQELIEVESAFLSFLATDIDKGNVVPLDQSLLDEIDNLVGDIDIDLDSEIEGDVDI
jgi:hypothetical protein